MKLPFFSPKDYAGSASVAAAIAEHDTVLAHARGEQVLLEAERRDALLHGDDAVLDRIDAKARTASLALDRLQARREALAVEHREQLSREAAAALDARRAAAAKKAEAARRWLSSKYPALAKEMVAGLQSIVEAEIEVREVNAALRSMAREDELAAVEPEHGMSEGIVVPLPVLHKLTRLVAIEGKAPGWGRQPAFDETWAAATGLL